MTRLSARAGTPVFTRAGLAPPYRPGRDAHTPVGFGNPPLRDLAWARKRPLREVARKQTGLVNGRARKRPLREVACRQTGLVNGRARKRPLRFLLLSAEFLDERRR